MGSAPGSEKIVKLEHEILNRNADRFSPADFLVGKSAHVTIRGFEWSKRDYSRVSMYTYIIPIFLLSYSMKEKTITRN